MVWGPFWDLFGAKRSSKWHPKSIRKMTSKKGGPREVRGIPGWAEPGSRRGVKGGGKPPPWPGEGRIIEGKENRRNGRIGETVERRKGGLEKGFG